MNPKESKNKDGSFKSVAKLHSVSNVSVNVGVKCSTITKVALTYLYECMCVCVRVSALSGLYGVTDLVRKRLFTPLATIV